METIENDDFRGNKIWTFSREKDGGLIVMIDGKKVVDGAAPGGSQKTECDDTNHPDWRMNWGVGVTGVKFRRADAGKVEGYKVVPLPSESWNEVKNGEIFPVDFDKSQIEVYADLQGSTLDLIFVDKNDNELIGWTFENQGQEGEWRFLNCQLNNMETIENDDFRGDKTWTFSKKDDLFYVAIDGKKVVDGAAPGGTTNTKCDDTNHPDWQKKWDTEVKGVKFGRADSGNVEGYQVLPLPADNNQNNPDRNKLSGSSKLCLNAWILVSALFAYICL